MLTAFLSSLRLFSLHNKHFFSQKTHSHHHSTQLNLTPNSIYLDFNNHLRLTADCKKMINRRRGFAPLCYSAPLTASNLQWISTISSAVLMLARGAAIQKSFLVPLFALQAPTSLISWIKGDYGIWTAFLALLVRLFFYIPGELELPFIALLMIIVAPYQVMNLRRRQEGIILSLFIAGYLAFQHFSRAGSLQRAFDQVSVVATLAIVCIIVVPCLLLI
ncbi:hypothetical protein LguiA_025044 [Lonicera macranthoides]